MVSLVYKFELSVLKGQDAMNIETDQLHMYNDAHRACIMLTAAYFPKDRYDQS